MKPLAIDLFCGLGGWAEGFLAEGYDVIGFDIEARPYPGQLVLQDALTLHGSQFRNAACIVASPPCQKYSYMAMPWSRAKAMAAEIRGDRNQEWELNQLFKTCFRLQREASEAAGHEIPMVVENVKGAQPWVGPARAHFGSFYLWGDINSIGGQIVAGKLQFGNVLRPGKRGTGGKQNPDGTEHGQGSWFKIADSKNRGSSKNNGGSWFNQAHNTESGHGQNPVNIPAWQREFGLPGEPDPMYPNGYAAKVPGLEHGRFPPGGLAQGAIDGQNPDGRKQEGSGAAWFDNGLCKLPSGSSRRAQASAKIAMIPFPLAQHIAQVFKPATSTRTSHPLTRQPAAIQNKTGA